MFKNKETVFYLFLVMEIREFCYSGLVCCGFFVFSLLSAILVNKDVHCESKNKTPYSCR